MVQTFKEKLQMNQFDISTLFKKIIKHNSVYTNITKYSDTKRRAFKSSR